MSHLRPVILNVASVFLALSSRHRRPDELATCGSMATDFLFQADVGNYRRTAAFLGCYRLLGGSGRLYYWAAAGTGAGLHFGSGSRGGGALAVVAGACVYLAAPRRVRQDPRLRPVLHEPARGALHFLFRLDRQQISPGLWRGIDLTERTFIWRMRSAISAGGRFGYG